MWGIFWRLFAAHLFAQFPLLTNIASRTRDVKKLALSHALLVGITTTLVVVNSAVFRPVLFAVIVLMAAFEYALDRIVIDWIKPGTGRGIALAFAGRELINVGGMIFIAAAFGWGFVYPGTEEFSRLCAAVVALWGAPHYVHIVRSAIRGEIPQLPYVERFGNFAFIERTLLFAGISARSLWICAAGILIAFMIRLLLYLNEENVRFPVWEWAVVAVMAGIPRILFGGIAFFGIG